MPTEYVPVLAERRKNIRSFRAFLSLTFSNIPIDFKPCRAALFGN